jgi:WD40 repeat protein
MNPNNQNTKTSLLQGHLRPIKDIKISEKGNVIYTASNDRLVISWNTTTGEKIKTFIHSAAVNFISITSDGKYLIAGDSTGCVYLWDTKGGVLLKKIEKDPTYCVRSIDISTDDAYLMIVYAGRAKGAKSFFEIYKLNEILSSLVLIKTKEEVTKKMGNMNIESQKDKKKTKNAKEIEASIYSIKEEKVTDQVNEINPYMTIECKAADTKYYQARFIIQNKSIIVSREDGSIELINFSNGKIITENKFHSDLITDIDIDRTDSLLLTASIDGYACLVNIDTFQVIQKFHPLNPTRRINACKFALIKNDSNHINADDVNCSKIDVNNMFDVSKTVESKKREIVSLDVDNIFNLSIDTVAQSIPKSKKTEKLIAIITGGQDSKLVTTTNQKEGGFEIIVYDALDGNELTNFESHFGPVNTLAVYENILASGAEDATVRLHKLDQYLYPKGEK